MHLSKYNIRMRSLDAIMSSSPITRSSVED